LDLGNISQTVSTTPPHNSGVYVDGTPISTSPGILLDVF
jgi:hypothetical protein